MKTSSVIDLIANFSASVLLKEGDSSPEDMKNYAGFWALNIFSNRLIRSGTPSFEISMVIFVIQLGY